METTSKLLINKLILIGHRKNYEIPFYPGVNIIYGEEDSGKSSILELINYLLGAKSLDRYIELEQSVIYAVLEVNLNNVTYCIKRDIFDSKREIEVYTSKYENLEKVFPTKYLPSLDNTVDGKFFSDFLLDALNFPRIKIKSSPSKDNSQLSRLSFRDLFKYCYINQDDVGNKNFLQNQNHAVYPKIKEVFKYIFNLNDEEVSSLEQLISEKTTSKNNANTKLLNIKEFLETIEIESLDNISSFLESIKTNLELLEKEKNELDKSITNKSENYNGFKEYLQTLNYQIRDKEKNRKNIVQNTKRYEKLINDYYDDRQKLESILSAKDRIGVKMDEFTICPICEHDIEENKFVNQFSIHDKSKVNSEIKLLNKRILDLRKLLDSEKLNFKDNEISLNSMLKEQYELKKVIDEELKEHISPHLAQRDEIIRQKAGLIEKEKQIVKALKIRNEEKNIEQLIKKLDDDINKTREKLSKLLKNQIQIDNVLLDLKDILNTYLSTIQVNNCTNVDISGRTYLPMLRNNQYHENSSGGIRTVLSIGYLLNILEYSLETNTNLPRFLMIDTVGKYLQKTKSKYLVDTDENEDTKEDIKSAIKYKNLYEYIISLSIKMEESNKDCQIILVDNDVPPFIEKEFAGFVIKRFSKDPKDDFPIGLIDDFTETMY